MSDLPIQEETRDHRKGILISVSGLKCALQIGCNFALYLSNFDILLVYNFFLYSHVNNVTKNKNATFIIKCSNSNAVLKLKSILDLSLYR